MPLSAIKSPPIFENYYSFLNEDEEDFRTHPLLIECIETLGEEEASGQCAKLKIINLPDHIKFYIHNYDGYETIHETHSQW